MQDMSTDAIQAWRSELKEQKALLEQSFFTDKNPTKLLKQHAALVDSFLLKIWQHAQLHEEMSLIAVGGYGRQELFPHSDIDLLILVPENITNDQNTAVEALISTFWDLGLNIGHSVRNLQECIVEASTDVTTRTNMLESRLICGTKENFLRFNNALKEHLDPYNFLKAKEQEQIERHAKYNDTSHNLEPNIKESPGGLRDLHTVLWMAKSKNLGANWAELAKNNVITQAEYRAIKRHERNLNTLRIRLHYLAKRREDRLLFDFQNELAANLGFVNTAKKRASEQLMQTFYRSVRYISLINEVLIKSLIEQCITDAKTQSISDDFIIKNQLLEITSDSLFQRRPSAILECFLLLQTHPAAGFGPKLIRQLQSASKLVTKAFRQESHHQQLFLDILKQKNGVHQSLRRMNRYGILGRYIPAFGRIIGQMQHDLFHVYTVDEHTLNVLGNLRRFAKPELEHEFPLCSNLFSAFEKPYLLYLAAIFHDIAKGRGGDHSELGSVDAKRFCRLHKLSEEDAALVAWLVESHLQHSRVSQKSDLSDPAVIEQYANFVSDETRLTALYLLTVADVRGTSPAVWNAWKARLLESLFLQTRNVLNDAAFTVKRCIKERQQKATRKLADFGLAPEAYQAFWDNVGDAYFSRYSSNEISWQTRLLIPHVFSKKPIVRAKLSRNGDGIQVLIYTLNQNDLFARICNFFDRIGYNIAQAKIYTTDHDYALNELFVIDESHRDISYNNLLKTIENDLKEKIDPSTPLEAPLTGRLNRQVKHMPINTEVVFEAMPDNTYHVLDIVAGDRPGLLANIAFIFIQHQVELHNAKINTLGNRAEDTFLISAMEDQALIDEQISQLDQALREL